MSLPDDAATEPTPGAPRDLLIIAILAGLLFLLSLGARDLWAPNEPIYGRAVVEMSERGDWLIPTVNDKVFAEKPILYFWLARAASALLGGVDEFSLRLPSALAGVISALLTYLLVLPYVGRRRALLASALFVTQYQVFWAARAVQMDVLVMVTTIGVLIPLTRMLDFDSKPAGAWALAGLAAGLGCAAKGPVALVIPGLVFAAYLVATRRLAALLDPRILIAAATGLTVGAPWYLALWQQGETQFLYEVLIRQNFGRFVEAWDHQQPWWYYLKYLWLDYAPWALLLPAAALEGSRTPKERKLHLLAWLWIGATLAFFSLSDSKRAPYILPVAPAVAVLASGVVGRWMSGARLSSAALRAARVALAVLASALGVIGIMALLHLQEIPIELGSTISGVGLFLVLIAGSTGLGLVIARRAPALAPMSLLVGMAGIYLIAALWVLPALDPLKSTRGFASVLNRELATSGGQVVSYDLWDWRAGYPYYVGRAIPNLTEPADLHEFWAQSKSNLVLVEWRDEEAPLDVLPPDAIEIHRQQIGGRTAALFGKANTSHELAPIHSPASPAYQPTGATSDV